MTKDKLDKIKGAYRKKRTEHNKQNKKENTLEESNHNFELKFQSLYLSQIDKQKRKNNFDKLQISINTIKSEVKKTKNSLNIDYDNNDDINEIILEKHKSYEDTNNYKSLKDQILYDYNNTINDEATTTMTSMRRTISTYYRNESNSAKDAYSNNSDYIDLTTRVSCFTKSHQSLGNNFFGKKKEKNEKKIRNSYYNKLITSNIWDPSKKPKISNTLFFFDWDDTLMCTSYLLPIVNKNNTDYSNLKQIKSKLKNLDENVYKLLNKTLDKGLVFIVTNSAPGWVEYSSINFLPTTSKILNKIKIISARGQFSKVYPGSPRVWKTKAFLDAVDSCKVNKQLISNILCFGDSIIDVEAIYELREHFTNAYLKIIKFKERPHPIELEKQVFLIGEQLDYIVKKIKDLNVKIAKKKTE